MFMNRAGIRRAIKTYLQGYPENGATGESRLNDMINLALRRFWGDAPKTLLREEIKFRLQPAVTGTCAVRADDARVFIIETNTVTLDTDGEHDARWVDITDTAGVIHTFRVREVFRSTVDRFVLDRAWFNTTDTGLTYRMYTKEYPIPADVKAITHVQVEKAGEKPRDLFIMNPEKMARYRAADGLSASGRIESVSLADYYQLEAPQFTPVAATPYTATPAAAEDKWGWDPDAVMPDESSHLEPGGTFSYRCCLVWGRRPLADGSLRVGGYTLAATDPGERLPFYISSPSEPSDVVTAVWGGSRVAVISPDVDADLGYAVQSTEADTYSGVEKWWFRARHSVDTTGSSSFYTNVQADGVYRLWAITPASTQTIYDNGHRYPPSTMVLKDNAGHRHLIFDRTPDEDDVQVIAKVVRTPPTLTHDSDSPNLPSDCIDALIFGVGSIAAGHRDGNLQRVQFYDALYNRELDKLRREYATDHFHDEAFGDGLGTSSERSDLWGMTGPRDIT